MLADAALREGVAGLVHQGMGTVPDRYGAPERIFEAMRQCAMAQDEANARAEDVLDEVYGAMAARSIRPVLLRSLGLITSVYGDRSLRGHRDHALLVHPEDSTGAMEALDDAGFEPPRTGGSFRRGVSLVDLHIDPYGRTRIPDRSLILRADTAAVIDRAVPCTITGREVLIPSPADRMLLLGVHAVKHSFDRLIRLVDVAECWRAGGFDLETLAERGREEGSADFLYYSLTAACRRLGAPIPGEFLERIRPGRRRFVDSAVQRYIAGNRVNYLPEWLLLYQVKGVGNKARTLWELLSPREEISRIRVEREIS